MTGVEELLSRARETPPGTRHRFTLAGARARETQARSGLRTPGQFALELVGAAVFAGGRAIAVETSPARFVIAWVGGTPLGEAQLRTLLDGLFVDPDLDGHRSWHQLAVACNHLLLRPDADLVIESGADGIGWRARLGAAPSVEPVAMPADGTWLRAGWRAGWAFGTAATAEATLLGQRCPYVPVPLTIDGDPVFGWRGRRLPEVFGALAQRTFDGEGCRGVVALPRPHGDAGLRVVIGGAWVATVPWTELASRPIAGVLVDDRLRRTADLADVVRDERWRRLLEVAAPVATALIRENLVDGARYRPPAPPAPTSVARLPPALRGVAPRPDVPVGSLDPAKPLYVVDPADEAVMTEAADPIRFDAPLVVADASERARLEPLVLGIVRLGRAPDVALAARALDRSGERLTVVLRSPAGGWVHARWRLGGHAPAWSIVRGDPARTVGYGALDPALGGLRVVVHGPDTRVEEWLVDAALAALAARFHDHRAAGPLLDAALARHATWFVGDAGPETHHDGLDAAVIRHARMSRRGAPTTITGEVALTTEDAFAPPGLPRVSPDAWRADREITWWLAPRGPVRRLSHPAARGWVAIGPPEAARVVINDQRVGPWRGLVGSVRLGGPAGRATLLAEVAELGVPPLADIGPPAEVAARARASGIPLTRALLEWAAGVRLE